MHVASFINQYGFHIVAAAGMAYLVFYVWKWATEEVKPTIAEASGTLIGLIDRVRTLDNDLIRLHQKISVVLMMRKK